MQRAGSSFSTGKREPGENRVASRCPSVALAERNQGATLPVQLLRDDSVWGNGNDEASFQMKVDAHGFAPEDLVVRVDGQNLTVTGQRQQVSNDPTRGRYRMEQSVHRQMQLPTTLDTAAMTCSLTPSGHLWVRGQNKCLPASEAQGENKCLPAPEAQGQTKSLPVPEAQTAQAPRLRRGGGPKGSNPP